MSDIAKGIGGIFTSLVEIIKGIFATIFSIFEGAFNAVIGLFKGVFNITEGVLGFLIGNFFVIGTLVAVYFGYIFYQQRQGRNPAPISRAVKKSN
ncbi:hypothetical protein B0A52_05908 [Exophiala mesophila]|uniref:Uncharacterized protein n=1 Tax=Exophiala mesophila TaxID=212818 RepID=A0A438N3T2_EXOME|nr:hypothetical protein B0A52_05908 [Exophiala mesophila]